VVILLHVSVTLREVFNSEKYITIHWQSNSDYYDTLYTVLFNCFEYFYACILTYNYTTMTLIAITVFFFVEYIPEDGQKRPKHVGGLPHFCVLSYLIIVQLLEYMW
jgi:hypothetical protein